MVESHCMQFVFQEWYLEAESGLQRRANRSCGLRSWTNATAVLVVPMSTIQYRITHRIPLAVLVCTVHNILEA